MTLQHSWSFRRALLCGALLLVGNASAVARAQPVLTDDVANETFNPSKAAFGPAGLLAFGEVTTVTLWDTAARRRLARIALTPARPHGMPASILKVDFTGDGRLLLGTTQGVEVVNLRDTRQRQLVRVGAESVRALEGIADGMLVAYSSGHVVHYGGTPLVERERFTLPINPSSVSSIVRVSDRTFVAVTGRLFVHSGGTVQELSVGGPGGHRELVVDTSRNGELVIASGSHLARLSAQSGAVLGTATSSPSRSFALGLTCQPTAQRCYWTRGERVEVWRDDLSERVAEAQFHGLIDPASGRLVRQRDVQSSAPPPGVWPLLMLASEVGGAWEPLGAQLSSVSDVVWSSRPGELILGAGGLAYALRLADLSLTPLSDTRAPVAVGSDGSVLSTGPLGEVIVHNADLVEQRAIVPSTCNLRRLDQLDRMNTDAAYEASLPIEQACLATAPTRLSASPAGTVLAMTTRNGDLRWLDYRRARWLERVADFAGMGTDTDVLTLTWSSDADTVEAVTGWRRYMVSRRGTVTADEPPNDGRGASAAVTSASTPGLSARSAEGRLVIRRATDGAELTLTFVVSYPTKLVIAQVGQRFWTAPEAHDFVHLHTSAEHDLLAPEAPLDAAFDPQLVATFLSGAR